MLTASKVSCLPNVRIGHFFDLYKAWDKPEKAEEWRAKLEQIEDIEE